MKQYRLNLRLDPQEDAELIRWIESLPKGEVSQGGRQALREAVTQAQRPAPALDLEGLRELIAAELQRALQGLAIQPAAAPPADPGSTSEAEAKYGAKLDKMLGRFSGGR